MSSVLRFFRVYFFGSGNLRAVLLYKMASFLQKKGFRILSRIYYLKLEREYGVYIHKSAQIDAGLKLPHPDGIVIGAGVVISKNVTIYQQVTLGGARVGDFKDDNYPDIGDGTIIFAGAKVIGKISVGRDCVIGANAVVTKNVPDGCVAVGIPARILPKRI